MSAAEPAGVRYARSLGAADVGARVVVRRRLPGGGLGDLLGELLRWDEPGATHGQGGPAVALDGAPGDRSEPGADSDVALAVVRDRHGMVHRVRQVDVVASKRVPPAPPRRAMFGFDGADRTDDGSRSRAPDVGPAR